MTTLKLLKSYAEYKQLISENEQFAVLALLSENSAKSLEAAQIISKISKESSTPVWGVNVLENGDIHPRLAVNQVPTVVTLKNGKPVKKIAGLQNEGTYRKLLNDAPRLREDGTEAPPLRVTVYTTRTCPHCNAVKNHLKRKGVPFREVDVSRDATAAADLQRRTGQTGVPQTDINGSLVVGADIPKINRLIDWNLNISHADKI